MDIKLLNSAIFCVFKVGPVISRDFGVIILCCKFTPD